MQELKKILEDIERVKEEIVNIDCGDDYNAGIKRHGNDGKAKRL